MTCFKDQTYISGRDRERFSISRINFGVDGAGNFFTLYKKDRSVQQQIKSSESMMLHCLKKMRLEINGHCVKIRKRIQTTKELLGVCDTASWY